MRYKITLLYGEDGKNTAYVSPTNTKLKESLKQDTGNEAMRIESFDSDLVIRVVELLLSWEIVNCSMGNLDKLETIQNDLQSLKEGRHLRDIFLALHQSKNEKDRLLFQELESRLKAKKRQYVLEKQREAEAKT